MYLLYDDKPSIPVSYFGLSVIIHGLAILATALIAMKMKELKPIKKEIIEIEIATKAILQPVVPVRFDLGNDENNKELTASNLPLGNSPVQPTKHKLPKTVVLKSVDRAPVIIKAKLKDIKLKSTKPEITKKEVTTSEVAKPEVTTSEVAKQEVTKQEVVKPEEVKPEEVKPETIVPDEKFVPKEDFNKLDLKGTTWSEVDNGEPAPEVEDREDNSDSYKSLNKKYEAADMDSDLSEADQKNAAFARNQAKKIRDDLNKDTSALSAHTEKVIETEKKRRFVVPPEKQVTGTQGEVGGGTLGNAEVGNNVVAGKKNAEAGGAAVGVGSASGSRASRSGVSGLDAVGQNPGDRNGTVNNGKTLFGSKNGSGEFRDASGVRALRDLRQMPGNKKPEYTIADRRASKQGNVVYHAFINSDGKPERFVLIKSSGFQSLDDNTLESLRKWKFYPGQEGWVELPFRWTLTGGAVEAPSLLRR
jgi:TonB family protein